MAKVRSAAIPKAMTLKELDATYAGHGDRVLNDEVVDSILHLLESGNYINTAVRSVGVGAKLFGQWCTLGRKSIEMENYGAKLTPYQQCCVRLYRGVPQAVAKAESRLVEIISKFSNDEWKAAAWMLERKQNAHWGYIHRQEIKNLSRELNDKLDKLSDKELSAKAKELARLVDESIESKDKCTSNTD